MHERKCKIWSLTWRSTPIVRLKHCLSFGLLLFFYLFFPGLQFGLKKGLLLGFPGVEGNPSGLGGVLLVLHSWLVSQCALFKSNRLLCIRVKNFQSFLIDMKFWTQSLFWLQAGIFSEFSELFSSSGSSMLRKWKIRAFYRLWLMDTKFRSFLLHRCNTSREN